jgi:hypothetical protein
VNVSSNPFITGSGPAGSSANDDPTLSSSPGSAEISCPLCSNHMPADSRWQSCPYCQKWLQIRVWPIVRQDAKAVTALSDQATCFFHPDKTFQACCQRCGRFVCGLCDLQLGSEHVCPICFERGRADSGTGAGNAEWRYRDVLYDSIALTAGWAWILVWPVIVAALPAVIFLHVKYAKAPRSYLIPRSGWRFWTAYAGFVWLPLLIAIPYYVRLMAGRH